MTRARSLSRGFGAVLGLVLLIAGAPLALIGVNRAALGQRSPLGGVKAPWRWSSAQIRSTLAHHVTESTIIDVVVRVGVGVLWLCLVVVLATIIAELISQLRHGVALPAIRGLGWSQRIAGGLVAGLLSFAPLTHSSLPSGGSLPIRRLLPVAALDAVRTPPPPVTGVESAASRSPEASGGWRWHRVAAGESVWDIGARLSGGGAEGTQSLVRQILDANLGRLMSDGSVFDDPGYIDQGWLLRVPQPSPDGDVRSAARPRDRRAPSSTSRAPRQIGEGGGSGGSAEHRIVSGDTLWAIVEHHYGHVTAEMVSEVAAVNHLTHPANIPIGTLLSLPRLGSSAGLPDIPRAPRSSVPEPLSATGGHPHDGSNRATIVVRHGDTMSSIAASQYGDANDWPAIFDANRGRHFGARTFSDPNLILPGWELTVPDDPPNGWPAPSEPSAALVPAPAPAPTTSAPEPQPTVQPAPAGAAHDPTAPAQGSVAPAGLPDPPNETAPADLPAPDITRRATGAELPADPSTSPPSVPTSIVQVSTQVGATPTVVDPSIDRSTGANGSTAAESGAPTTSAQESVAANPATLAPTPGTARSSVAPLDAPSGRGSGQNRDSQVPLGPASAMVLATGALGLIHARRRRRLRAAGYAVLREPEPSIAAFESGLRQRSSAERLARLDLSIRCAAPAIATAGGVLGGVLLAPNGDIDLLLSGIGSGPIGPPSPFQSTDRATVWRLPANTPTEDIVVANRFAAFPCPLLTHVGVASGADVFVDLEAFGVLSVLGERQRAQDIVNGLTGSLSLSPFAETVTMLCVGLPVHADALPRLTHLETVAEAAAAASDVVGPLRSALQHDDNTFDLRTRSTGESWEPVVIAMSGGSVEDQPTAQAELRNCSALATPGRGLAVIVDQPVEQAACSLHETETGWLLTPFGLTLQPVGLTEDDLIELDELIASADAVPVPVPLDRVADPEAAFQEQPWALLVRLLGPVDVVDRDGIAASFSKSKAVELVAWLAEHRATATRTGARAAMWDSDVRDATFSNVVSEARRSLARLARPPEGVEWIARTLTEHLPLHSLVVTDAMLMQQRLDFARACADDDEAIYVLVPAVQLVRDVPYSGVNYLWSDSEGWISNLTLLVTAAAAELARRYLAAGDIDGVFWATGQGLIVLPGHEELIALRMRARAAAGDLAGVKLEWEGYERVLNADLWGDGEASAKMTALRQQLLRPSLTYRP
jgi:nucleoid-associated protein YgaU